MSKEEIQQLLLRYKHGQCTQEEISKIHQWYEDLHKESSLSLKLDEKEGMENRILSKLHERIEAEKEEFVDTRPWRISWMWYSGVAALLIFVLSYSGLLVKEKSKVQDVFITSKSGELITHENQSNKNQTILLEDLSVVTLLPGSKIIYPKHFSEEKRNVQLEGNAFFEIAKNPKRPFLVYTGKLVTRVLGTSFWIRNNPKSKVLDVEVVTGKVSVFENLEAFNTQNLDEDLLKNNNGVVLTPNQRVTYYAESRHLMTGLVNEPVKIESGVSVKPKLEFNNMQLPKIFQHLEEEYGIEIVLGNDRLEKCTFTGDVSDIPLYDKLDLICKSNQASYEIKGTRILINGEGCD